MTPAHNFVISLPIVSTHQVCAQKFSWPKVRINLALPRNEIKLFTAGAHRHNHHAITYDWVPNFRVCLIPLPSPGLVPQHLENIAAAHAGKLRFARVAPRISLNRLANADNAVLGLHFDQLDDGPTRPVDAGTRTGRL